MDEEKRNYNAAWRAAAENDLDSLKELWSDEVLKFGEQYVGAFNACPVTLFLSVAANRGSVDTALWILKKAECSEIGLAQSLQSSVSANNGKLEIVQALYEAGASPVKPPGATEDVFYYLDRPGHEQIKKYLDEVGAIDRVKAHKKKVAKQKKRARTEIGAYFESLVLEGKPFWLEELNDRGSVNRAGKTFLAPADFEVPTDSEGTPLGFVASLDLATVNGEKGVLLFFVGSVRFRWDHACQVIRIASEADESWIEHESELPWSETLAIDFGEEEPSVPNQHSHEFFSWYDGADHSSYLPFEAKALPNIAAAVSKKRNPKTKDQLFGHPFLVQDDPRGRTETKPLLLLQLYTVDRKNKVWGKQNPAMFFIEKDALSASDFSDVQFWWQR